MIQLAVVGLIIYFIARQFRPSLQHKWVARKSTLSWLGRYLAADARAVLRKPVQQPPTQSGGYIAGTSQPPMRSLTDAEWDAFMEELDDE